MNPDRAPPAHPVSRGRRLLRSIGSLILRAAVAVVLAGAIAPRAEAQRRPVSFIRDAEVEATIRSFAAPLFAAASLDPAAISVHLVNDRSLNAFVANGLNMYLNTGLLMRSDDAGQVIGVIAHETGHIQGGHLAQMREQISQSMVPMILEMLATFGAAGAGMRPGNPNDWGGVRGGGGPSVTERFLLRYSRGMENQADQAAITLLERTGQSPRGLKEFLDILADQELLQVGRQDPYVRTHPVTRERVEFLRAHLAKSRVANTPTSPALEERHARMRGKLRGFLEPGRVNTTYKPGDESLEARYARAIAAYKTLAFADSARMLDALIRERPDDPFFIETRAQFQLEQGKAEEARVLYARAAALAPNEPLVVQALGSAELQAGATKAAIATLERARRMQPQDADTWRLLAQAYGRDNQVGLADYAQAEHYARLGRRDDAAHFAGRAMRQLPAHSPAWLRAQDIRETSQRRKE